VGEQSAREASAQLTAAATAGAEQQLHREQQRLTALAARNPLFDRGELEALAAERRRVAEQLRQLQLRLDAIRVIVVT